MHVCRQEVYGKFPLVIFWTKNCSKKIKSLLKEKRNKVKLKTNWNSKKWLTLSLPRRKRILGLVWSLALQLPNYWLWLRGIKEGAYVRQTFGSSHWLGSELFIGMFKQSLLRTKIQKCSVWWALTQGWKLIARQNCAGTPITEN